MLRYPGIFNCKISPPNISPIGLPPVRNSCRFGEMSGGNVLSQWAMKDIDQLDSREKRPLWCNVRRPNKICKMLTMNQCSPVPLPLPLFPLYSIYLSLPSSLVLSPLSCSNSLSFLMFVYFNHWWFIRVVQCKVVLGKLTFFISTDSTTDNSIFRHGRCYRRHSPDSAAATSCCDPEVHLDALECWTRLLRN